MVLPQFRQSRLPFIALSFRDVGRLDSTSFQIQIGDRTFINE